MMERDPTRFYRIEIRRRAIGRLSWRWEIYHGAEPTPIVSSINHYPSQAEARAEAEIQLNKIRGRLLGRGET
jgi:hypothetical protein